MREEGLLRAGAQVGGLASWVFPRWVRVPMEALYRLKAGLLRPEWTQEEPGIFIKSQILSKQVPVGPGIPRCWLCGAGLGEQGLT